MKLHLNKIVNIFNEVTLSFYLWLYENLIHLFGVVGTIFAIFSILAVFVGNFVFAFCLLSISLMSLWLDIFIKEED